MGFYGASNALCNQSKFLSSKNKVHLYNCLLFIQLTLPVNWATFIGDKLGIPKNMSECSKMWKHKKSIEQGVRMISVWLLVWVPPNDRGFPQFYQLMKISSILPRYFVANKFPAFTFRKFQN